MKRSMLAACRMALRPLIRMLLRHGVMHREFVELSKDVYVEVARGEYGIRGRPTNASRVALLTGLDRKEVARVRDRLAESTPDANTARRQDRIARVLSGWFQDEDYLDADGKPVPLSLTGLTPSYEDLVKRYGGNVPGVTILRELTRTGAVRVSETHVKVLRRNYRLDTIDTEALERAGSVLADIGRTVTHNLYRNDHEPSRFEARASNALVPVDCLPEYRELIYREAQVFLENVDAWLSRQETVIATASGGTKHHKRLTRLGLGIYWIQNEPSSEVLS